MIYYFIIIIILILICFYNSKNNLYFKKNKLNFNHGNKIPKKIFQTHKSWDYINTKPSILECINSWKRYTDFEYYFYNDSDADTFIKNNFNNNIYKAYRSLSLPVMKADLWRYCVIYAYGGIYADTDTKCLVDPNCLLQDSLLVCVPESDTRKLCQWIFAAPPKSPIIKKIIDMCVTKILNNISINIDTVLEITGPVIFTQGVDAFLKENNYKIYSDKLLYTKYSNILHVFYPYDFHLNIVQHIFSGFDEDGWKLEASKKSGNKNNKRLAFERFFNKNIKPLIFF